MRLSNFDIEYLTERVRRASTARDRYPGDEPHTQYQRSAAVVHACQEIRMYMRRKAEQERRDAS